MPTQDSIETARRLKLIVTIDDGRPAADPFKLPGLLRADVVDDVANLEELDVLTGTEEGERTEASGTKRKAFTEMERQLRGVHRFIQALDDDAINPEERKGLFESYLWQNGQIGQFDDERRVELARQAIKIDAENLVKAEWRCPAVRLARIQAQLAIIEEKEDPASGGGRQAANRARNTSLELAATTLLRVRFWYCCASRDADKTPELARIEYQPKRPYGSQDAPAPGPDSPVPPV